MKRNLTLATLIFCFVTIQVSGQYCGSELQFLSPSEQRAAQVFHQQDRPVTFRSGQQMDSVAVTVHIVGPAESLVSSISMEDIENEINRVNGAYRNAGIQFFICGSPRYVTGETIYNRSSGDALNRANYVPNTINIYFVDDIETAPDFIICGFAQFPFVGNPEGRYIMMNKLCSTNGATLTHELGHFYGLYHTHTTVFGAEFANGSNCDVAGDMFCDTPADPNLLGTDLLINCSYVGDVVDPNGDPYSPDISNFMSYAPSFCQRNFSPEQLEMVAAVHQNENAYLASRCDFYPDFSVNSESPDFTINSTQDLEIDYQFQNVGIDQAYEVKFKVILYDDPEGEVGTTLYEEELLIQPGNLAFTLDLDLDFPEVKSSGTFYLEAILDPDLEFIERTEKNNVIRSIVTVDNSRFGDQSIFPNPAQDEIFVLIREARSRGDLNIRVFRYDGVQMLEERGFKGREEYIRSLNIADLPRGIYFLLIDFEKLSTQYSFKFYKH